MLTNHGVRVSTIATLALSLALPACVAGEVDTDEEVAAIAEALERENGGFDMTDEAPAFGEPGIMDDATLPQEDIVNPYLEDLEVQQLQQAPDAVVFQTVVLWGQFPGDFQMEQARNWSGVLHVNRGAMLVRTTLAFEGPTDNLLPRPDPQTVAFSSATRPHHDGLRLTIIDPEPLSPEPLQLTYATSDGPVVSLPMVALVDGPIHHVVDGLDNRVVAMAVPQPLDLCAQGMLGGHWRELAPGRGKFRGPVVDPLGEPIGHVRGIYGVRSDGDQVFFGKYINRDGHFMGIFAGRYADERFEGRWLQRAGDVGVMGGQFRDAIPGPESGGHFLGHWAETSCSGPAGS